jgi:hypothetical protein
MRAALVALFVASPAIAFASPFGSLPEAPVVWQNRVIEEVAPLTSVSHKLYLNDCRAPGSCTVSPGFVLADESLEHPSTVTLDPYGHGDQHWELLVVRARDARRPTSRS